MSSSFSITYAKISMLLLLGFGGGKRKMKDISIRLVRMLWGLQNMMEVWGFET